MSEEKAGCLAALAFVLGAAGVSVFCAILEAIPVAILAVLVYKLMEMWANAGG